MGALLPSSALEKQKDEAFAILCAQVKECLRLSNPIQERTFSDISKRIINHISGKAIDALPSSFYELSEYVRNYWKYESDIETDYKRGVISARLYQLTHLVYLFNIIQKQENQYRVDAVDLGQEYFDFLHFVDNSPGISHNDLSTHLRRGMSVISKTARYLEEKGYLLSQRIANNTFYQLSYSGTCLLNRVRENEKKLPRYKGIIDDNQVDLNDEFQPYFQPHVFSARNSFSNQSAIDDLLKLHRAKPSFSSNKKKTFRDF